MRTLPTATALPSFGTKIPNGERVPCPPDETEASEGCTPSGFCFGLGHPSCGGFQPENRDSDTGAISLNPFGDDWRATGFKWTAELCGLDSDGDGYTNGEELGDPCCTWVAGSSEGANPVPIEAFVPSHPGLASHVPEGPVLDLATFCESEGGSGEAIVEDVEVDAAEDEDSSLSSVVDARYNEGESRGSLELRMNPYPIPIRTTTYVDFVFNLPDDFPDLVHVVFAEVINSQPDHLHHFVLTGCANAFPEDQHGNPIDDVSPTDCNVQLGGWAPGMDPFGTPSLEYGVALGPGMGIAALHLNVHYTDGVYEDEDTETHKMATDGMKIHYTTDFRPFTTVAKPLIWVTYGPKSLAIPANESRFYTSRTCQVESSCTDAPDENLQRLVKLMGLAGDDEDGDGETSGLASMLSSLSCQSVAAFCFLPGELQSLMQMVCPETCGLCGSSGVDGTSNPRNPESYRITGIHYHAHLLGSEMYATLLREEETQSGTIDVQKKNMEQATEVMASTRVVAKDLKSRDIWHYDDQASIPLEYDLFVEKPVEEGFSNDSNNNATAATAATVTKVLKQGVMVKAGDEISVTCVFDSTARQEPTAFGPSTYQEMCIVTVYVTFDTPRVLLDIGEESSSVLSSTANVLVDLNLRSFGCGVDDEFHKTDVHTGTLSEEEDGRNIWRDHPIGDTKRCTYPVRDYIFSDSVITRNEICPEDDGDEDVEEEFSKGAGICDSYNPLPSVEVLFMDATIAGATCTGGKYDQMDGNEQFDNVTEEMCLVEGKGSSYEPYTCLDAQDWLDNTAPFDPSINDEVLDFVRDVWQGMCCRLGSIAMDVEEEESPLKTVDAIDEKSEEEQDAKAGDVTTAEAEISSSSSSVVSILSAVPATLLGTLAVFASVVF